jgi:hypothetical protein
MGTRLTGEEAGTLSSAGGELVSFGVVRGAIQLPPGGEPVILHADHQTTGGYPLLGVVAEADWPIAAQLAPGDEVTFEELSVEEARRARANARAVLAVFTEYGPQRIADLAKCALGLNCGDNVRHQIGRRVCRVLKPLQSGVCFCRVSSCA